MSLSVIIQSLLLSGPSLDPPVTTPATVIYGESVHEVERTLDDGDRLWVLETELVAISGFTLKEEGLCRDDVCIPTTAEARADFVRDEGGSWIDLTRLAAELNRVSAHATTPRTWLFSPPARPSPPKGERPIAPGFSLLDRNGFAASLSDHRGHKVLLVTWASW